MKTMMKKCGICAALAAVLLAAALVTGCTDPSGGGSSGYTPPEGMGYVRLNFAKTVGESLSRTIMPGAAIDDFAAIELDFIPNNVGGNPGTAKNVPILKAAFSTDLGAPINLMPGDYTLTVNAYMKAGPPLADLAAGASITTPFTIQAGGSITRAIVLRPIVTGSGKGTFEWDIEIDAAVTDIKEATMTVTEIGDTAPAFTPVDLETDAQGEEDLVVGYYYVDFYLERDNGSTVTFRHVLHIYQNMKSSYDYAFEDGHFVILAGKFTPSPDIKYEEEDFPVELEYDYDGAGNDGVLAKGDPVTIHLDDASGANPTSVTITVTNDGDYDTFEWYYGAELLYDDDEAFLVDTTEYPFGVKGQHHITVICTTVGGVPYATYFIVEVED